MTYAEKLRLPQWQKRRLEILSRDQFACVLCGDNETELQIHHKYYTDNTEPWEYPDDALQTLCRHCHTVAENLKQIQGVPILVAKREMDGRDGLITVSCIYRGPDGGKGASFFYYSLPVNKLFEVAFISPKTLDQVKTLIQLSEKL